MRTPLALGIDLGTTHSVAASIDADGRTRLVRNGESENLTPSVVLFEDAEYIVGKAAKTLGVLKADRFAEYVKREMGQPHFSRPIDGMFLPPEVIQACILHKIRRDVTARIGPDFAAVITVPAFFDDSRRRATAVAGEIAGLHVLDIVNEPMAGALAFGEQLKPLQVSQSRQKPVTVLVYDLGGGTFDVTLLRISSKGFETLATDGDVLLGGRDWDLRLAGMVSASFVEQFGSDPRDNPFSLQRLMVQAEEAKRTLSVRQKAMVRVEHAGSALETEVSRSDFEEATADLVERTAHTTRRVLAAAGLSWPEVHHVMLVGGATRMPMIPHLLTQLTNKKPETAVSPDEAVARGAAIYAQYLLSKKRGARPQFEIYHVNSHDLGVQGVEPSTGERVNGVLIERNTRLPAQASKWFATQRADQRSISLVILEGDSRLASECRVIGRACVSHLPPGLPAAHPVQVSFEYSPNGRLQVRARTNSGKDEARIEIARDSLVSDVDIASWREAVCGPGDLASFRRVLARTNLGTRGSWQQVGGLPAPQPGGSYSDADGFGLIVEEVLKPSAAALSNSPAKPARVIDSPGVPQPPGGEIPGAGDVLLAGQDARAELLDAIAVPSRGRRLKSLVDALLTIVVEIVFWGTSALTAAFLAQLILWWVIKKDPLDIAPTVPAWLRDLIVPPGL